MPYKILASSFSQGLIAILILSASWALDVHWPSVIGVVAGAFTGALLLTYFKREGDWRETILKVSLGTLCGIILGAVIVRYLQLEPYEYKAAAFTASGMLSLILLRALINVTEVNTEGWLTRIAEYYMKTIKKKDD